MLYLSQVIGRPVRDRNGEPIGKVADLIVAVGERYPPVTGLVLEHRSAAGSSCPGPRSRRSTRAERVSRRPTHRHRPSSASAPTRSCCGADLHRQADRRHRRPQGGARQRPPARRRRGRAAPRGGRRRRGGPRCAGSGWKPSRDARPPPRPADPGALHRLGGRRPGRDVDRLDQAASPPRRASRELHPADLADIIDQLSPRDRAGVLASLDDEAAADAIEEMEPETQVEVLEDLPPGARRRHPRGDEPRRRGRPRGRPVRRRPATRSWR